MCGRIGTAIAHRAPSVLRGRGRIERQRVLGRQTAARRRKNGTRPSASHPVARAIVAMPSANSAGSPRNLLTRKPRISAASSASITALVPTRLAITPPRSMSPISTTGTSAARAKPILAMSLGRRLTSDALPAPSTRTRSASRSSCAKLSSTNGISVALHAPDRPRPWRCRDTLPCTTICAPISLCGFSSTGFMCTLGGDARGARLQRLRAADLAAVRRSPRRCSTCSAA